MTWLKQLRTRPRLIAAVTAGVAAATLLPASLPAPERAVIAWNAAIWLYLSLVWIDMTRLDQGRLRQRAVDHADGARIVLALAIVTSVACLVAVVTELAAARAAHDVYNLRHVGLALVTLVGSWLLLPTEFALAYASRYYAAHGCGLAFPGASAAKPQEPNYLDFMYFAVTIAAASQTSDVTVTTRDMRTLVLVHAALSFAFNALVLALAINLAAGLF
ncbi:MAG: DUF1345 domain-containing protein [Rubrivivax sp.]|nr:DUF1345 domain-containing protein [Rubrivivax sp.]